jgi:hypothetical protein
LDATRVEEAGFRVYAEWNLSEKRGLLSKVGISKYGKRARYSSSKEILPARTFADIGRWSLTRFHAVDTRWLNDIHCARTVDKDRMAELENEIGDIAARRREIEGEIKKTNEVIARATADADNLKKEMVGAKHHYPLSRPLN